MAASFRQNNHSQILVQVQKRPIIMCYAPINFAPEEDKVSFYEQLQSIMDKIQKRDKLVVMGDMLNLA